MVNEIMATVTMTDDKQTDTKVSANKAAEKEDLLRLFDQYSDLMSSNLD